MTSFPGSRNSPNCANACWGRLAARSRSNRARRRRLLLLLAVDGAGCRVESLKELQDAVNDPDVQLTAPDGRKLTALEHAQNSNARTPWALSKTECRTTDDHMNL